MYVQLDIVITALEMPVLPWNMSLLSGWPKTMPSSLVRWKWWHAVMTPRSPGISGLQSINSLLSEWEIPHPWVPRTLIAAWLSLCKLLKILLLIWTTDDVEKPCCFSTSSFYLSFPFCPFFAHRLTKQRNCLCFLEQIKQNPKQHSQNKSLKTGAIWYTLSFPVLFDPCLASLHVGAHTEWMNRELCWALCYEY